MGPLTGTTGDDTQGVYQSATADDNNTYKSLHTDNPRRNLESEPLGLPLERCNVTLGHPSPFLFLHATAILVPWAS
jgi:hypothetical protein